MRIVFSAFLAMVSLLVLPVSALSQGTPAPKPRTQPRQQTAEQIGVDDTKDLPSAITLGLRAGLNSPSDELSSGFVPDVDLGYRWSFGTWAIEPAVGWQMWSGDAEGTLTSPQIPAGSGAYTQELDATVIEGRVRGWYHFGKYGSALLGVHLGAVNTDTTQTSFGVQRDESGGELTWAIMAGYAYSIPAAYGNVQVQVGWRDAPVDYLTTGAANVSGLQAFLGWQVAYPVP